MIIPHVFTINNQPILKTGGRIKNTNGKLRRPQILHDIGQSKRDY